MRLRITILLLIFSGLIPGKAQIRPDSLRGVTLVVVDGQEKSRFALPAEASAAKDSVQHLLQERFLQAVRIRAGASPDGKTSDNNLVSGQRAEAAIQLVRSWAPNLPETRIKVISVGEDYTALDALLRDSGIPGAEEARRIIASVPTWVLDGDRIVSSRKKQLMDLRGGQTWLEMKEKLFPMLKDTQITFYFGEEPEALVQENNQIVISFPFGDATVRPSFNSNRQALSRLDSLFSDRVPLPGDTIVLIGKASMDGPEKYNVTLARQRAENLRSYFTRHYPSYTGALSVRTAGEAWDELRAEVVDDSLLTPETRDVLLEIIDAETDADRKEARLKTVPGWRDFARKHYPDFRVATLTPVFPVPYLLSGDIDFDSAEEDWPEPVLQLLPDRLDVPALTRRPLRPVFGVSTNLLYDIAYVPGYGLTSIPSFSLEYYPARSRHFTYGLDLEWPMWQHWDTQRFLQVNNLAFWTRRYFPAREDRFRGLYLQAGANVARFGLGWDARGWQGEGIGAGLGIGHKWLLGRSRLFIDCGAALGVFYAQYDPYVYGNDATHRYYYDYSGDPAQFVKRNHRFFWAGPTRIYISLGIDLFNRKRR